MPKLYALHQALFSFGGDAWIEDDAGNRLFEVDGKTFTIGRTLDLLDPAGNLLYTLHQPVMTIRAKFEISRSGAGVATIEKALFSMFADTFTITLADGGQLEAKGDFLDHEFVVTRDGTEVVSASRAWFSMHDTYGVRVADDFDDPLALTIVIAIEQMERQERQRQSTSALT